MKILPRRKQNEIAAHLALIYHCLNRFALDLGDESERTYLEMALLSLVDVAAIVGGVEMMWRIPELADKIRDIE